MATIKTYLMPNSSVLRIYSDKEVIKIDPEYQRKGDVWTLEKKQLLVDSILNEYDVPKLYFHSFSTKQKEENGGKFEYAIIDGRQRVQTIFEFIDGVFALSDEFEYLADKDVNAKNLTYADLAVKYPKLKIRFDAFTLPIILVETEDIDLIEDMFSRLNEAVPLNAAEKRNSFGGLMAKSIRELAEHSFFKKKVKFKNNRLQHLEVVGKLLLIEHSIRNFNKIIDTKKPFIDKMVKEYRDNHYDNLDQVLNTAKYILDEFSNCFVDNDNLLKTQSPVTIFYLVFRNAIDSSSLKKIDRQKLVDFYNELEQNRLFAETDISQANFDYLEYDRLSQQGTNDASSIKERTRILCSYLDIDTQKL